MGRHRAVDRQDEIFRLLFVCTGNICRSPLAEILTRHLLVGRLGGRVASLFDVRSAGVRAVVGVGMHPDSRAELAPWGLDGPAAGGFVARQLTPAMTEGSHLVLGASPRHRSTVVEQVPAALSTAFSLREFARLAAAVDGSLLPDDPVARAHSLVELARQQRGLTPPVGPEADRIPDPISGSPREHREAALLIGEAVRAVVDVLASRGPGLGPPRHIPPDGAG